MRRGLGRAVFNSNNSGNPYYLYNCIVDEEGYPLCRIDMGCYENLIKGLMLMLK